MYTKHIYVCFDELRLWSVGGFAYYVCVCVCVSMQARWYDKTFNFNYNLLISLIPTICFAATQNPEAFHRQISALYASCFASGERDADCAIFNNEDDAANNDANRLRINCPNGNNAVVDPYFGGRNESGVAEMCQALGIVVNDAPPIDEQHHYGAAPQQKRSIHLDLMPRSQFPFNPQVAAGPPSGNHMANQRKKGRGRTYV